jgi:alcohol dehydrogenase (NADP+)
MVRTLFHGNEILTEQASTPTKTLAYAILSEKSLLGPFNIERRALGPHDIQLEILYCGICHSDIHTARNEWKNTVYPCIPGHEIVGRVSKVGKEVKGFKPGDLAAVGCMVDSCQTCNSCKKNLEQYCEKGMTLTYNSPDKHNDKVTYGGYTERIVVDEKFVLHIPKEFTEKDLPGVAPLLCAGITTYSPLKHWKVGKGTRVGVVGLGGLGHMAIKLAHAMGAHVVLFTTSPGKSADAKRFGANEVVISKNPEEMKKYAKSLDFIINTVAAPHNLDTYLELLKLDGTMCLIGAPDRPHPSPNVQNLIFQRRSLAGSLIGGIKETQEMLDFCGKNHITCDIELIPIQYVNQAYDRVIKSDVKYRFVIDNASLKAKR